VIKTSGLIKLEDDLVLKSASTTLTLPALQLPSLDEAKSALEKGKAALELAQQQKASAAASALLEDKNRVLSMTVLKAQAIERNPSRKDVEL
jgi:hypothetical protein